MNFKKISDAEGKEQLLQALKQLFDSKKSHIVDSIDATEVCEFTDPLEVIGALQEQYPDKIEEFQKAISDQLDIAESLDDCTVEYVKHTVDPEDYVKAVQAVFSCFDDDRELAVALDSAFGE